MALSLPWIISFKISIKYHLLQKLILPPSPLSPDGLGELKKALDISFIKVPINVSKKFGLLISYDLTFRTFKALKLNL